MAIRAVTLAGHHHDSQHDETALPTVSTATVVGSEARIVAYRKRVDAGQALYYRGDGFE